MVAHHVQIPNLPPAHHSPSLEDIVRSASDGIQNIEEIPSESPQETLSGSDKLVLLQVAYEFLTQGKITMSDLNWSQIVLDVFKVVGATGFGAGLADSNTWITIGAGVVALVGIVVQHWPKPKTA